MYNDKIKTRLVVGHWGPFLPSPVKVNGHLTSGILSVNKSVINRLALTDTYPDIVRTAIILTLSTLHTRLVTAKPVDIIEIYYKILLCLRLNSN